MRPEANFKPTTPNPETMMGRHLAHLSKRVDVLEVGRANDEDIHEVAVDDLLLEKMRLSGFVASWFGNTK